MRRCTHFLLFLFAGGVPPAEPPSSLERGWLGANEAASSADGADPDLWRRRVCTPCILSWPAAQALDEASFSLEAGGPRETAVDGCKDAVTWTRKTVGFEWTFRASS
jgi:hypothetical protein